MTVKSSKSLKKKVNNTKICIKNQNKVKDKYFKTNHKLEI